MASPEQPLYLVAHMQVRENAVDAIRPAFIEHARRSRQKAGNVFFYLVQDREDSTRFSTMECWETMDHFQQHLDDEEHQSFQQQLQPRLAGEPDERRYQLLDG